MSVSNPKPQQRNIEFPITKPEGGEEIKIFDLTKIFQMSYNFDPLQNLLESLIENQKKLKTEIQEVRSALSLPHPPQKSTTVSPTPKKEQTTPQSISAHKQGVIRPPPIENRLEVSANNDDIINKIVVNKINFYIILFQKLFFFKYRKK